METGDRLGGEAMSDANDVPGSLRDTDLDGYLKHELSEEDRERIETVLAHSDEAARRLVGRIAQLDRERGRGWRRLSLVAHSVSNPLAIWRRASRRTVAAAAVLVVALTAGGVAMWRARTRHAQVDIPTAVPTPNPQVESVTSPRIREKRNYRGELENMSDAEIAKWIWEHGGIYGNDESMAYLFDRLRKSKSPEGIIHATMNMFSWSGQRDLSEMKLMGRAALRYLHEIGLRDARTLLTRNRPPWTNDKTYGYFLSCLQTIRPSEWQQIMNTAGFDPREAGPSAE
jgi:hypothetical protein